MLINSLYALKNLNKTLRQKPSELKAVQERKLRAIIRYAFENVPLYNRKLKSAGLRPSDIRTLLDLERMPITTKAEIRNTSQAVARDEDLRQFEKRKTSGSTGIPLTVFLDKQTATMQDALTVRCYFQNGMKPWDKMVRFVEPGFETKKQFYQTLGLMRVEYLSVLEEMANQADFVEKRMPTVLRGYSSCLELLARFCHDNGRALRPKHVFTGAECLTNETRRLINSEFQGELTDMYSSVEFGLIAWECECHCGYHINSENLITEFIKNGSPIEKNERGQIVITDLSNTAMPFIRYDIGDVGTPLAEECSCGRTLPLMKPVEGRVGDYLVTLGGRIIPPTVFFPFPFGNVDSLKQFRIIQSKRDLLIIQIVLSEGFSVESLDLEEISRNVKGLFGTNMDVRLEILNEIKRDPNGKLRKIISHVPISF